MYVYRIGYVYIKWSMYMCMYKMGKMEYVGSRSVTLHAILPSSSSSPVTFAQNKTLSKILERVLLTFLTTGRAGTNSTPILSSLLEQYSFRVFLSKKSWRFYLPICRKKSFKTSSTILSEYSVLPLVSKVTLNLVLPFSAFLVAFTSSVFWTKSLS